MMAEPVIERIENAIQKVTHELHKSNQGYQWDQLSEDELFAELVSCIIGSQVVFEKAKRASDLLRQKELLTVQRLTAEPKKYEIKIYAILNQQKCLYARTKARYIVTTAIRIYVDEGTSIQEILESAHDQYAAREVLAELCLGIGLKQASLFLRNIHYADDLAILDTHVLSYMSLTGLKEDSDKSLNRNKYLSYENQLRDYSQKFNISVAQLDVSIWVVMRVISREFRWML